MTLQWRVALLVAVVTTVALLALLAFDRMVLVRGFEQVEDDEVRRDVMRVLQSVEVELDRLDTLASDWASWDDSYAFAETRARAFVESNLPTDILESLDLGAIVFLDTSGSVIEARAAGVDGTPGAVRELASGWEQSRLAEIAERVRSDGASRGVLRTDMGTPLLLVARPLLRSDGTGTPRGALIFARWMGDEWVEAFGRALATPTEFLGASEAPPGLVRLDGADEGPLIVEVDGEPVGYGLIRDIVGEPAVVVRTTQERAVGALATRTRMTLVGSMVALGAVAAAVLVVALRLTVLEPMRRLQHEIAAIEAAPIDGRVTVAGADEVAAMARAVNGMLEGLAAASEEHRRLHGTIEEQRDLAATALDAMSEGLLAFDVHGFCTVCNPAAARLLGTSEARARGRHVTELLPGTQAAPLAGRPDGPQLVEVGGRTLAVSRDRGGSASASRHSVVVLRDVTEVLDVERLRRDVISTVSHELRTPLTAIQATVEMLDGAEAGPRNEVQANLVALLSRNVARLRRILDDLLTLSTLEGTSVRLDRDRLDLGVLAARVAEDLRPTAIAAGVGLRVETRGDAVAWVDETRMRQVLENLIQNAVKFSPPERDVLVTVTGAPGEVRVAVTDHGPGIPPEELRRVFERFYRSASVPRGAQGTGLGLPIARTIVELHGGRIWLESDGRTGTAAYVTVPSRRAATGG